MRIRCGEGCARRILLGHDIGGKARLHPYGGFGYDHILNTIVPVLKRKGVSGRDLDTLLRYNTADFLDV